MPDNKHRAERRPPDGSKLYPTDREWDRFWRYVEGRENPTGCWLWVGAGRRTARYGSFGFRGERHAVHRFAYRAWPTKDPIPADRPQLDHRCRNSFCVNPDHLDPVTNKENSLRGIGFSAVNARKTHCPKGHRYTPENTLIDKWRGMTRRRCRICKNWLEAKRQQAGKRLRFVCDACGKPSARSTCYACVLIARRAAAAERDAVRDAEREKRNAERAALKTQCRFGHQKTASKATGRLECLVCRRNRLDPNRYRELRARGLCVQCGRRSDTYRCQECRDLHNRRVRDMRRARSARDEGSLPFNAIDEGA